MEQLAAQCKDAPDFPQNVVTKADEFRVKVHTDFLNKNESQLFQRENKAALDFLDFYDHTQSQAFWLTSSHNLSEIQDKLNLTKRSTRKDPQCRYIFVHAPNSRDRLRTTRHMLMLVFTYHRIMPEFLDFLPAFGSQRHARNFNFSAFYQNKFLRDSETQASIPELGWSGRGFRLCYNIKTVEPSPSDENWPWSARQTALHHSFDVETGRAIWIDIKGDQSMKKRIKAATDPINGHKEMSSFASLEQAFLCTLATHNLFIQWSTETLRPYINFLENEVQTLTRGALHQKVESPLKPNLIDYQSPKSAQANDWIEQRVKKIHRRYTEGSTSTTADRQAPQSPHLGDLEMPEICEPEDLPKTEEKEFSFSHLQDLQKLEEKANETVLILTSNANILSEIRDFYQTLQGIQGWPTQLRKNCKTDVLKFKENISSVLSEYKRHKVRLSALLRLLGDRKSLLYGILEHQNLEASRLLASEARTSAESMETMTLKMTSIAKKTNQETIYMRIITFVTLAFLPGTFISVGRSTLMSTPVVHFDTTNPSSYEGFVQWGPLSIYLALSLPLVAVTLLVYLSFYLWENRKQKIEEKKRRDGKIGDISDKV